MGKKGDQRACDPNARYQYQLTMEDSDPFNVALRGIKCTDPWADESNGSWRTHCRRAICECDRGLAYRLSAVQDSWNNKFHKKRGSFDDSVCQNSVGLPRDACCGRYEDYGGRFPYAS